MENVIRLLKTLADPTRLRLLRLVALDELTVGELAEVTGLAQSRVSNHLRILREDGLLRERHEGAWHFYTLEQPLPEQAAQIWPMLERQWEGPVFFADDLDRLRRILAARTSRSQAYFERVACEWDNIRTEMFGDALAREMLRALVPEGLVVADIGTGTGYVAELFGPRAGRLIAIDNSESMLAVARLKAQRLGLRHVEFRQGEAENPPLEDGEADVVSLCMVLHHVQHPEAAIAAAARALKPTGVLLLGDFVEHRQKWLQEHMEHRWLGFGRVQLDQWLHECGLAASGYMQMPGRHYTSPEGRKLEVPDAFLCCARPVPQPARSSGRAGQKVSSHLNPTTMAAS